jgi:hypothetical protein
MNTSGMIKYFSAFILITTIGVLYDRYKQKWGILNVEEQKQENIKKYLLNEDSILNGKPILWIHNKYEINSRNWDSFYSRNNDKLNQPYKKLCVETIIKQCGDDFNICLIDDDSFLKLVPGWSLQIGEMTNPVKSHIRKLALSKLLYYYGGMLIPSSSVAVRGIKCCYNRLLSSKCCFVGETLNKAETSNKAIYFPNTDVMGCKRNSPAMKEYMLYLERLNDYSNEYEFDGKPERFMNKLCREGKVALLKSKFLGQKDTDKKEITLEKLMSSAPVKFDNVRLLIINGDDLLKRTKYEWFCRLNKKQILESKTVIGKLLSISLAN